MLLPIIEQRIADIHRVLDAGPAELTDDQVDELLAVLADLVCLRYYLRQRGGQELAASLPRN